MRKMNKLERYHLAPYTSRIEYYIMNQISVLPAAMKAMIPSNLLLFYSSVRVTGDGGGGSQL